MRHISPQHLQAYLQSTETAPLLLDVREPWEFERARIEGSELIPLMRLPQHAGQLDPAREIVVICHHGVRSQQAAHFLEQNGFNNVINLVGGINAWSREVDPQIPVY